MLTAPPVKTRMYLKWNKYFFFNSMGFAFSYFMLLSICRLKTFVNYIRHSFFIFGTNFVKVQHRNLGVFFVKLKYFFFFDRILK